MSDKNYTFEQFTALIRKNEETIKRISAVYYIPDSPLFREMMTELTTYLWTVYSNLSPDFVILREEQWVYTILYRHASNYVRDEQRRRSHFEYGFDFSQLPYIADEHPHINRMYHLIDQLEADDRDIILMYLDKVSVHEIAKTRGKSISHIYRRIKEITATLCRLNQDVDDYDDEPIHNERSR